MTALQGSAQETLRRLVDQIERLEDEKKGLGQDISDKFKEAKSFGFDVKVLRTIIRMRKKSKTERDEEDALISTYMAALGMLADLPLGRAAVEREFGAPH